MAQTQEEEIVLGTASPVTSDHKRKHEDLEPDSHQLTPELNGNSDSDSVKKVDDVEEDTEAKRQRLDDKPADLAAVENGHQQKDNNPEEVGVHPHVENLTPVEDEHQEALAGEAAEAEEALKEVAAEGQQADVAEDDNKLENAEEKASEGETLKKPEELEAPAGDTSQQEVASSAQNEDEAEGKSMSRKMEVPNNKVGVLIGKAGDTIRYLQYNSGARIQITRDADADPYSGTRPVELIGTLDNITKAEKLIKDVIAEADAGGSPALVARGFNTVQAAGAGEQIEIQVPNEKVGLIIGKGGETIKNLQTRSGARIQLIPQHLPEGDQSKERTVRVSGDKKQIELARELIKEVMDQFCSLQGTCYNETAGNYYGRLEEVVKLTYRNGHSIMLFKCHWFDSTRNVKVDKHRMATVNVKSQLDAEDIFVLASQVVQVYYAPNINNPNSPWYTVVTTKNPPLNENKSSTNDALQEEESNASTSHVEPIIIDDPANFFIDLGELRTNDEFVTDDNEDDNHENVLESDEDDSSVDRFGESEEDSS